MIRRGLQVGFAAMAASLLAAGMLGGDNIMPEHRADRPPASKKRPRRVKPDRTKKQFLLKGVRP